MKVNTSWDALLNPQGSEKYFDVKEATAFEVGAKAYSHVNAWWLAELSRFIYRSVEYENREKILREVGLREVAYFEAFATQASLIESIGEKGRFGILVFRGSSDLYDWITNLDIKMTRWSGGGEVHEGFVKSLKVVWPKISQRLRSAAQPVYVVGHSLGGALAVMAALRLKEKVKAVYTFGAPRLGNLEFVKTADGMKIYRVVNHLDVVPTVPPSFKLLEFRHAGQLHYMTHDGRMWVNPDEKRVSEDKRQELKGSQRQDERRWYDPPENLSDHAPVNYVAQLEKLMKTATEDEKEWIIVEKNQEDGRPGEMMV